MVHHMYWALRKLVDENLVVHQTDQTPHMAVATDLA